MQALWTQNVLINSLSFKGMNPWDLYKMLILSNGLGNGLVPLGNNPDSKVHRANMGPTWVLPAPDGPILAPWTLLSGKPLSEPMMTKICDAIWYC